MIFITGNDCFRQGKRIIKVRKIPTCSVSALLLPVAAIHFELSYFGFIVLTFTMCLFANKCGTAVSLVNQPYIFREELQKSTNSSEESHTQMLSN